MRIYILTPIAGIVNKGFISKLKPYGEVVLKEEITKISELQGITDEAEKVLAIDPDFCDWNLSGESIRAIKNLKAIVVGSTSFSWVDIKTVNELDIAVLNTKNWSTNAVAEWAVMMALNTLRRIPLMIKNNFPVDFTAYQGVEMKGKTAAIIGMGNIGKRIAEICTGLGMEVVYWSQSSRDERFTFMELTEIFTSADVIFPAVAQNEETEGLITDEMLKSMKATAVFVSIVHHVYNHELLLKMVEQEEIYGYAFEDKANQFAKYEGNVWAAPEYAWCTAESYERNSHIWAESIQEAAQGDFSNKVN